MRKYVTILIFFLSISACKKRERDLLIPEKVIQISPAKDEACITGITVSETENKVVFRWKNSAYTDSYELNIKNLENGSVISKETSLLETEITLIRNKPYSWIIVSKSSKSETIAKSEEWRFFNSGFGISSHAPFPAEIVSPTFGLTISASLGKIVLDWNGSDVDNDILNYDVYFGTNVAPTFFKNQTESILSDIAVVPKTIYYWKIITRDAAGNSSDSGIYQFKTE